MEQILWPRNALTTQWQYNLEAATKCPESIRQDASFYQCIIPIRRMQNLSLSLSWQITYSPDISICTGLLRGRTKSPSSGVYRRSPQMPILFAFPEIRPCQAFRRNPLVFMCSILIARLWQPLLGSSKMHLKYWSVCLPDLGKDLLMTKPLTSLRWQSMLKPCSVQKYLQGTTSSRLSRPIASKTKRK